MCVNMVIGGHTDNDHHKTLLVNESDVQCHLVYFLMCLALAIMRIP